MTLLDKKVSVRKPKKKQQENNSRLGNNSALSNVEDEESDYSDGDFQDLMSNKQIEENFRVFLDRIHELVNPIDHGRLKLDSVQQIKTTVKTFYKKKAHISE